MSQVNTCFEIKVLRKLNPHKNIVNMFEVVFDLTYGTLGLTFELMEMNLYQLILSPNHSISERVARDYTFQICTAVDYIHSFIIIHSFDFNDTN